MKIIALSALTLLVASCAAPAKHFGDVDGRLSDSAVRSFALQDESEASAAVRDALIDAGFDEREDGRLRVEVGFSIRPDDLAVLARDGFKSTQVLSPPSESSISLCDKEAYVLTLAFIDTSSGKVVSRSGATMSRCSGEPAEILRKLARAALPFPT